MARREPTDLCSCGHPRSAHARTVFRCRVVNGYRIRCECPAYEHDPQANDLEADTRDEDTPDTWLCPHGNRTDGTWGKCDRCDDLHISEVVDHQAR